MFFLLRRGLELFEVNTRCSQIKRPFSMDCRERGSHARGVYPTQDTSRTRSATVKQEEKADNRIISRE